MLEGVRELLDARNVIVYCPAPGAECWDIEFCHWVGADAARRSAGHLDMLRSCPSDTAGFAAYDPFAVQAAQRNRALTLSELVAIEPSAMVPHRRVQTAIGSIVEEQLRALLCQGPRLLAWFGAIQDRPFTREAVVQFQQLVDPLRARLQWHRHARSAAASGALVDAVLEAFVEPTVLLSAHGRIEHLNHAAEQYLARPEAHTKLAELRAALRAGAKLADVELTQLCAAGMPPLLLVRFTALSAARNARLARAAERWRFSSREAAVLEQLLQGRSNKEVAAGLGCAEVTVERYLSSMYRKSGCGSRTTLVARVHEV